jgi:hypothetical protein
MKEIIQGHYYHLPFIAPYTHKGPFFVQIGAIARKSTLELYGDFDIRGTFFDEVGMSTYLTMVPEEMDVYVANLIESNDPIEIKTDENIFIPKSLIDFSKAEEYFVSVKFVYNVEGVRRFFDLKLDQIAFVKSSPKEIDDAVMKVNTFLGDLISTSISEAEYLESNSRIKADELNREQKLKEKEHRLFMEEKRREDAANEIYTEKVRLQKIEKQQLAQLNALQGEQNALNELRVTSKEFANKVEDIRLKLKMTYDILYDYSAGMGTQIASWEDILNSVGLNL